MNDNIIVLEAVMLILKVKGVISQEEHNHFFHEYKERTKDDAYGMSRTQFLNFIDEVLK